MAKVSEIGLQMIKDINRIDYTEDDLYIENIIMPACKDYIKNHTGLTDEQVDTKEDLTIAFIVLVTEMYTNKEYMIQNNKVNLIVDNILNRYCVNLL